MFGGWSVRPRALGSSGRLGGPELHLVEAGLLDILVCDRARRAGIGAGRVALTEVALDDLAGRGVVVDRAERAGDGANLATDAEVLVHDFDACGEVGRDRVHRAGLLAPGLRALGAGIRHHAPFLVEVEDANARFGDVEFILIFVRAGHLALLTPGALAGIDHQRLEHRSSSSAS